MLCGETLAGFFSQPLHAAQRGRACQSQGLWLICILNVLFKEAWRKKESLKCYYMEDITNSLKVELVSRVPTEKHFTDNWAFVDLCYLIYE